MLEMLREDFARIPALIEAARPAAVPAEPDPFVAQEPPAQEPPQLGLFG
jgi:hypothetical protein